jgi:phosphatidate cytidylyltransferase
VITRILSTIALWALVIAAIHFGGAYGGLALLAGLCALAQYELHALLEKSGLPPWNMPALTLGIAIVLGAGLCPDGNTLWLAAALGLMLGAFTVVKDVAALPRLAGSVFAIIYVPGLLQFYALIMRDFGALIPQGGGVGLAVWVIAAAKFTDVGGYAVGRVVGRHKLAPSISPGKTWEGVVGGLVFAAGVGYAAAKYLPDWLPGWLTPAHAALLALPIGAVGIISDLSESALKRRAGVKDSGNRIPGIGGALDLADSLLLAAPTAYYLFHLTAK